MRHGKKIKKLSRTSSHRKAMMANMANSLILHKRITTTLPKAKALRTYVEPLITKSKNDTTHSRRVVFSYLKNKETVSILFREISQKIADRPGGYTRVIKLDNRQGDNAEMAFIELVDYNEVYSASGETKKKSTRRSRRRGGKKKSTEQQNVSEETENVDKSSEAETKVEEKTAEENVQETKGQEEAGKAEGDEKKEAKEATEGSQTEEEQPDSSDADESKNSDKE